MTSCSNCGLELQDLCKFCPSCGTQVVVTPDNEVSLLGKTLNNKYRILSEIGSGTIGTVYLAEHIGLKKRMAVKVLRPGLHVGEESLKRFQREGIAAGKFSHPNAIQIFDFDLADEGVFYLAMEYIEGSTLKAVIGRDGCSTVETAVKIIRQVLSVLAEAHSQGIVHRDLKPENIMVLDGGNGELRIKVLDFGLSKLLDLPAESSLQTQEGRLLGTPLYMAPEQCGGGPVDHRIDLYSAGLILYEMLTGHALTNGDTLTEIIVKRLSETAPSICERHPDLEVPADLDTLIRKALEKEPENRYQSAGEMITALEEVRYDHKARPGTRRTGRTGPAMTISLKALLGSLAVILVVVSLVWLLNLGGSSGSGSSSPRVSLKSPEDRSPIENSYISMLRDAQNRLETRDLAGAMAIVENALRLDCVDAEGYLVRGRIYGKEGDLDMARADFQEALDMEPGFATAAAELGWVFLKEGDQEKAIETFDTALAMDQRCAEALAGKGAASNRLGDRATAITLLEQAVEIDSSFSMAYYHLGVTHMADGAPDKALDCFVQAKRHDAKASEPYMGLGEIYLQRGDIDQAEAQFREVLNLDPDAREVYISLASLLVERERFSDAQDLLEQGINRHSDEGRLHILLGVTLEAAGQREEAIESLLKGVELATLNGVVPAPGDLDARVLLGILLQQQGIFPKALEQYQKVLEGDDNRALALLNQGLTLFSLNQYEKAAVAIEKALYIDYENAFAHYCLGVIYMDYLGDKDLAVKHLSQAEALGGLGSTRERKVNQWLEAQGQ